MDWIDNKEELFKKMDEQMAKVEAIQELPEYEDYLKYKKELETFKQFVNDKRAEKTYEFIIDLIKSGEENIQEYLERIKSLEDRLSLIQRKKGYSFSSCNVMDLVWECFKKYGENSPVTSMFGNEAYRFGKYTMELYSGQGEY